jgi:hypothetical protein
VAQRCLYVHTVRHAESACELEEGGLVTRRHICHNKSGNADQEPMARASDDANGNPLVAPAAEAATKLVHSLYSANIQCRVILASNINLMCSAFVRQ